MTDILLTTYFRKPFTMRVLTHIFNRTPADSFRMIVTDNGSTDGTVEEVRAMMSLRGRKDDIVNSLPENLGLERAKNIGLAMVTSDRLVDLDNDCLCAYYGDGDSWLERLHGLMDRHPEYGAIAARCQILVGVGPIFKDADEVKENNVCGGSFRLMDTALVRKVGGWRDETGQNRSEEHYICGKIREQGRKCGYATNVYTRHLFGNDNAWGYNEIDHKHGDRSCPYTDKMFDACDPDTLVPANPCNE